MLLMMPAVDTEPVEPEVEEPEAGTTGTVDGAGADSLPVADTGAAEAATGAEDTPADAATVEVAEGPAGAKRRLLTPHTQSQPEAQQRQLNVLDQIPSGTPLTMAQVRQLLNTQALAATEGSDSDDFDDPEALADAAKKTPTYNENGCEKANKWWRFGGSVPNRTCEQVCLPAAVCSAICW